MIKIDTSKVLFIQKPFNSGSAWVIRIFFSHYYIWVAYRWSKSSDEEMNVQEKVANEFYQDLQRSLDLHTTCSIRAYQAIGLTPLGIGQDIDL